MTIEKTLVAAPGLRDHLVGVYPDNESLTRTVGLYLGEGLRRKDAVVVVATAAHREAFCGDLQAQGIDVETAVKEGRLRLLDAEKTLSDIMVNHMPDWPRFNDAVGGLIEALQSDPRYAAVRAYGEMVDLLWQRGNSAAMVRLEEFWDRLLKNRPFTLLCAYMLEFLHSVDGESLEAVLRTHTHLVSLEDDELLERTLNRAMDEVFGAGRSAALRSLIRATRHARAVAKGPETVVLWLRRNLPDYAEEVLERVRRYYGAERNRLETP